MSTGDSTNTNAANNNWRNPSAAHRAKYGLNELPESFQPTDEELQVLAMYDVIKQYEKVAAKLKADQSRQKLQEAELAFQQQQQQKRKVSSKKKRQQRNNNPAAGTNPSNSNELPDEDEEYDEDENDENEELSEDDEEEEEDIDNEEELLRRKREEELEKLRQEVEEARKKAAADQEDTGEDQFKRQYYLEENTDDIAGPLMKKKKEESEKPTSSLIANLTAAVTPPHDFSEKLELKKSTGKVLFPVTGDGVFSWTPPAGVYAPNDGAFCVDLTDFDVNRAQNGIGNNTVAIKFMAPADSKRFSINIATSTQKQSDFDSVLFHFNPRQRERGGQLVINDKQESIWGQAIAIPLSQIPLMFGQTSCTLLIQINGEGFDIFVENSHCARLEHRTELPTGNSNLVLQFPSTDDYGSVESWTVYKVWWGNRPILAKGDVSGVPGVNSFTSAHPRKLFVSGLAKISNQAEVELRRAELERAFWKYGGDRGVQVIVPTHSTYAFVEMESERMADLALAEMADKYRLNRARRSRHEALQEERAAAEAAKLGVTTKKEDSAW
jgi:chemotaxis protein histidine kinase CheA